ncbi:hypothetical protein K461DRAFT_272867 [Myriangium duriaei CBS 260.36]|uniref:RING-type domain-containing protein n=1 Tax=Myriangium duriaei CBS 260.36 TaxID=1168546 RepID=A0A9P4JDD1_9PEZI|nr:hypothetical protein K461DRAFT_272867 [Myriangium duriaei CBS 260.36]
MGRAQRRRIAGHEASLSPSVPMPVHTWSSIVEQTELIHGKQSTISFGLDGFFSWLGQLPEAVRPSVVDANQELPRKRIKLEHELGNAASGQEPSDIPIARMNLHLEPPSPETLPVKQDERSDRPSKIAISLISVRDNKDGTAILELAPFDPKSKKPRLHVSISHQENDSIVRDLDFIARIHRRTRMNSKACEASATVLVRQDHSTRPDNDRYSIECAIWWTDGGSGITGAGGKDTLELSILDRFCALSALTDDCSKHCSAQDFYDSVHVPSATTIVPDNVFKDGLTTELYPFQRRAVHWMLQREGTLQASGDGEIPAQEHLPSISYKATKDVDGNEIFISALEATLISSAKFQRRPGIKGGILAEEMGLGKTCEMLSLICLNKRRPDANDPLVASSGLIPTRATLIATPITILQQWKDEIERHAPHLSCTHYQGRQALNKAKQQEDDAVKSFVHADIVLTTYKVLADEIHFAVDPPDRSMRRRKETPPPRKRSPLVQMHWWRTVLDEAQMVESGVSNAALTATLIPRHLSWAVSGTPVKKDVQDLRGLLIFLRFEPFASSNEIWRRLVNHYGSHFQSEFKRLFSIIALRHTKDKIRGELKLPPQRRIVVNIPFTAVEEQNYTSLFEEMAYDCGLTIDGSPLTDDWDPNSKGVIERMRGWLVRLRQTCLHPQVGRRNQRALGRSGDTLRTVEEVLAVMIEQNEGLIRTEIRMSITTLVLQGHILANAKGLIDRAERSLELYKAALADSESFVGIARDDLRKAGGKEIDDVSDNGIDDDEENSEHAKRGRLRNNLRNALELQHMCEFFVGTAYFQVKSFTEGIKEGDDRWRELEEQETLHYDNAKLVRKEILRETAGKAERTMRDVEANEKERIDVVLPSMLDLGFGGGIESQRVLEKADHLSNILQQQTKLLAKWRSHLAGLLLKRLVDVDDEETTGEEYETSTKQQDEMYIYFDAYRAVIADRSTCITGQINTLVNHEMDQLVRESKRADFEDEQEGREPPETRELLRQLLAERKTLKQKDDGLISIRGLLHEARSLESSLQWLEGRSARSQSEIHLVRRFMQHLQTLNDGYNKLQPQFVKDQELFKAAMNQRLEFYRQLQQISDAVAPYKEELDDEFDQIAFDGAATRHEQHEKQRATLQSKQRFLVHLRDQSNNDDERICVICQSTFEQGVLTVCGHQFCKECINLWWRQHQTCPVCKRRLRSADFHNITYKPQDLSAHEEVPASSSDTDSPDSKSDQTSEPASDESGSSMKVYNSMSASDFLALKSVDLPVSRSFGTKIDTISRHLLHIRRSDPGSKTLIFSQYRDFLVVLSSALTTFGISHVPITQKDSITRFREDASIEAFLLDAKSDSSGLNLVNATNVMLCEPLVNPAIELQAIARVHRIGQTRPTSVFMYLVKDTVEQGVYEVSVARRMQLLHRSQKDPGSSGASGSNSRALTPMPGGNTSGMEIDRAERLEMQAGGLERLMEKKGGEMVRSEDLWTCLFSGAPRTRHMGPGDSAVVHEGLTRNIHDVLARGGDGANSALRSELGRFARAEAADARQAQQ